MMEWASGASAGHGYGTYTIHANFNGSEPGAAIVFWPGDNSWPGQEIDMGELAFDGSGTQYGNVHWNSNGGDAFEYRLFNAVKTGVYHDYTMIWEPGKISFAVDGVLQGTITDHVPTDFAHGGMNDTIGVMNTNPHTSVTVTSVDFTPLGQSTQAPVQAAAAPAAVTVVNTPAVTTAGAPDWTAVAKAVNDYHDATGQWVSYENIPNHGNTASVAVVASPAAADTHSAAASSASVDWNAIAAQVEANFEANGHWFM
jgi:beta-glucanase (GH16 family)